MQILCHITFCEKSGHFSFHYGVTKLTKKCKVKAIMSSSYMMERGRKGKKKRLLCLDRLIDIRTFKR